MKTPAHSINHVFMVMARFVPLIESRIKRTTVRANRHRKPKAGEYIDLRCWQDMPYRSRQIRVWRGQIRSVRRFSIDGQGSFYVAGGKLGPDRRELCARTDGFADADAMVAFFQAVHGLPFTGFITEWL